MQRNASRISIEIQRTKTNFNLWDEQENKWNSPIKKSSSIIYRNNSISFKTIKSIQQNQFPN